MSEEDEFPDRRPVTLHREEPIKLKHLQTFFLNQLLANWLPAGAAKVPNSLEETDKDSRVPHPTSLGGKERVASKTLSLRGGGSEYSSLEKEEH